MKRHSRLFVLCLAVSACVHAQSTFGSFLGAVRDPSGSFISTCVVTITNVDTQAKRSLVTDSTGGYVVPNLEPGKYEIVMEAPGFQRATYTNLELQARQTMRVDGNLALASQAQTVNVNEAAEAPINTDVSNITEAKLGRELVDLPVAISSRASGSTSAFTTLTTQPGVEVDNNGNLSVAGSKPSMLSVSVDGISTMSPRNSAPISELFPSFDSIAEIQVSEINNTAEYGGVSDITTISKSGTNTFHGGLYENNQNTAYDARNTFSAKVPKLDMNDFGFFLGGPVMVPKVYNGKDKTFFFLSYEGLRLPQQQVLVESVPTLALRNGDLSAYSGVIKDPTTGAPFAGNQIPISRISPLSLAALKYLYPLPNTGSGLVNNYVTNFPTPISSDQADMLLDRNINANHSVFARMTYKYKQGELAPPGSPLAGPNLQPEHDAALTAAWNWVISPRVVNELRAGYSRNSFSNTNSADAGAIANQLGLTSYLPQAPPAGDALPNFQIAGFQNTGGVSNGVSTASSYYTTGTYQVLDNITWTHDKHTFKFGGDYRYLTALYTNVFASIRLGSYSFNNSVTGSAIGNPFAAFLLGIPDSDRIGTVLAPDSNGYSSSYAFYGQDDWKVTSRLTTNYGLRWEYHPMFNDANYNTANFLPNYQSFQNGAFVNGGVVVPDQGMKLINPAFAESIAPTPILSASQAGLPQSLRYSQKTDFAPRVGFAWRATKDGKTVIRGGYGKFIEAQLGNLLSAAWAVEASDVAGFTNSLTNGKPTYSFPYPFPSNIAKPGTQVFDLSSTLHYKDPYVQQWNFTLERDLGFQTALRISYDGSHGSNLGLTDNPNQVQPNTIGYTAASKYAPYPLFQQIIEETNGGLSNYQSVTIATNKRFAKGLQFLVSYNLAKNLSDVGGYDPIGFAGSGGGTVTNTYNPSLDYGNVAFTRRQRFESTFLYELPFGSTRSKLLNQVVGGWELAGVLLFQTGPFLTVLANGADPSGTNFVNLVGNGRADILPGTSVIPSHQGIYNWVNNAAFAIPANNIGRFGDSPVGSVIGPGTQAVSLSMFRTFKVTERAQFRFGIAAANALNHPNYGVPNLTLGTPTFGVISSMQPAEGAGPRTVQLSGRFTF